MEKLNQCVLEFIKEHRESFNEKNGNEAISDIEIRDKYFEIKDRTQSSSPQPVFGLTIRECAYDDIGPGVLEQLRINVENLNI